MNDHGMYIDGRWTAPSAETIEVIDATTEQPLGRISSGGAADVDLAVAAARRAQPGWAAIPASERAATLRRVADGIAAREDEFADLISRQTGMVRRLAASIQVGLPIRTFRTAADLAETAREREPVGNSRIVTDPIGVVGAITPWNYPLHQSAAKIAVAMAAGCTVVHKPSEVAPLDALLLAEVMSEAGVPAGVYNLVSGYGQPVGEAIAAHPDINMVTFTGSERTGVSVLIAAAPSIKRVALELGGKSAAVVDVGLDPGRLSDAVRDTVGKCFLNTGQTCSAITRLLVPRADLAAAEEAAVAAAARLVVGDPFDPASRLGPVASAAQRERVIDYVRSGIAEGARIVVGGDDRPPISPGYYVNPTVFSDVTSEMTIAREEIFGPVLCIMPYDSLEEAIEIANGTRFGLAGSVWAADDAAAIAIAERMEAGQIDVNGGRYNPDAPFGGYKRSGLGREFGRYGFDEFLEIKALQLPTG